MVPRGHRPCDDARPSGLETGQGRSHAPAGRGGDMVWDDIPSIPAALKAHTVGAEDVKPPARTLQDTDGALYHALGVVESQERKSSSARVSCLELSAVFSPLVP